MFLENHFGVRKSIRPQMLPCHNHNRKSRIDIYRKLTTYNNENMNVLNDNYPAYPPSPLSIASQV